MATTESGSTTGNDTATQIAPDQEHMQLQSSDHPRMVMVSALLIGNNYFAWSRAVKRALTTKMKLDFIDGTAVRPAGNSKVFKRWNRTDSMVMTWILNCMSKELAEAFMYVGSSRELWLELEARFGESNNPMIYQLQREIGQVTQGNMSIIEYYTKLKKLWDELCAWLPHLNAHAQAHNQILLLQPLPSVTKAYSMLLRMEKQMQMNISSVGLNNRVAFQRTEKVMAVGQLVGNLYVLESPFSTIMQQNESISLNSHCKLNSCVAAMCNTGMWHKRLGHLSKSSMKHITSLPQINSIETPCDVCPLAKLHIVPFASSTIRAKSTFDLVQVDIWGPVYNCG
ncbi:UNVERIFIED_CONTAM: hypothetical protein Scaly_2032500 [Sesamum calycinum]|uniref:Retrotransposon Copia-like N-terminal domain-containing protein n=1 Tax=Sesamum calycinum TaxID=2727403 RepID=A0AAW2N1H4_9LAMI